MDIIIWIFLYLIVPVGLGVLGNVATPLIKSYFDRRSLSTKERRIITLIDEYKKLKKYKENSVLLTLRLAWLILSAQVYTLAAGIIGVVWIMGGLVAGFSLSNSNQEAIQVFGSNNLGFFTLAVTVAWIGFLSLIAYFIIRNLFQLRKLYNVGYFDEYKMDVVQKITKLGGNPEDLDRE